MVQLFEAALFVQHRSACVEVSLSLNMSRSWKDGKA